MAKNSVPSEDVLREMIELEVGAKTSEIAEGVFDKKFEDVREKMDGKISKLIYGVIAATAFLFISLLVGVWLFMGSYQQHYLETQQTLTEKVETLQKESLEIESNLETSIYRIQDKQDYIERILLNR